MSSAFLFVIRTRKTSYFSKCSFIFLSIFFTFNLFILIFAKVCLTFVEKITLTFWGNCCYALFFSFSRWKIKFVSWSSAEFIEVTSNGFICVDIFVQVTYVFFYHLEKSFSFMRFNNENFVSSAATELTIKFHCQYFRIDSEFSRYEIFQLTCHLNNFLGIILHRISLTFKGFYNFLSQLMITFYFSKIHLV